MNKKVSLLPILSVNFVDALGFSLVLPFLVYVVTKFGGNGFVYGIIGASYSFFQFIGAPILGRWSDRAGRKKILVLSQAGTLLSWLIFITAFYLPADALADIKNEVTGSFILTIPLITLFIARGLDGLTGGNESVADAYLADVSVKEERSKNYGKMQVAGNIGFVLGPAVAGILGSTELEELLPVIAAAVISCFTLLLIIFGLPESKPKELKEHHEQTVLSKIYGEETKSAVHIEERKNLKFIQILRIKPFSKLFSVFFFSFVGFSLLYVAFPIYAVEILKWEIDKTGYFFAYLSLAMVLVQGPVLTYVTKKVEDIKLVVSGSIILSISFLFFMSAEDWIIYAGATLLSIGNGLMWPSLLAEISRTAGDEIQGAVQGYAGSLGSMAMIIGLVIGGFLFEWFGQKIFIISFILIFITFFIALKIKIESVN